MLSIVALGNLVALYTKVEKLKPTGIVIRPASPKDVDDVELSQLNDDMCF